MTTIEVYSKYYAVRNSPALSSVDGPVCPAVISITDQLLEPAPSLGKVE
jgi:hypothetical protein